jgi:uncharacterized protein with PIN domain
MVLDTSAIIATITNEPDSSRFRAAMLGAETLLISSVAVLETRIVLFARLWLICCRALRASFGCRTLRLDSWHEHFH